MNSATEFLVIGVNYRTAPLAIREHIARRINEVEVHLPRLRQVGMISEGMLLSTCHRIEVYLVTPTAGEAVETVEYLFREGLNPWDSSWRYLYEGRAAIRHLFRVAASLEAMVVGEAQVLGQIKEAYRGASATVGPFLHKVCQTAFSVAKCVRTRTKIGERPVSISGAALDLAGGILGTFAGKTALFVGAGEMSELAARQLAQEKEVRIIVASRTPASAERFASAFGGEAFPIEHLPRRLHEADLVFASTSSPAHVMTLEMVEAALGLRAPAPLCIVDIGVPRDVDERVGELSGVSLFNIDDLEGIAKENRLSRAGEIDKAEKIVDEEVDNLIRALSEVEAAPLISSFREKCEAIRLKELDKTFSKLPGLGEEERDVVDALTRSIVNKILHGPLTAVKEAKVKPSPLPPLQHRRASGGEGQGEGEESAIRNPKSAVRN